MTFTLTDHKMKPQSMLYNFRSLPLVTGINKLRSETDLFLEQKSSSFKFVIYFSYFLSLSVCCIIRTSDAIYTLFNGQITGIITL